MRIGRSLLNIKNRSACSPLGGCNRSAILSRVSLPRVFGATRVLEPTGDYHLVRHGLAVGVVVIPLTTIRSNNLVVVGRETPRPLSVLSLVTIQCRHTNILRRRFDSGPAVGDRTFDHSSRTHVSGGHSLMLGMRAELLRSGSPSDRHSIFSGKSCRPPWSGVVRSAGQA